MADDAGNTESGADKWGPERKLSPEEQLLPAYLVERIYHVVRLAGLPLAVETGDAGVYLEREDPISGPTDHVVISWHVTDRLFDAGEDKPGPRARAAEKLMSAAYPAIEDALATLLSAGGLVVAKHPQTHSLAVWAAPGGLPFSYTSNSSPSNGPPVSST